MSTPSLPRWLAELIAEEGESKPMDVSERDSLLGALKAASDPTPLDPTEHQRILERALAVQDPFAPATEEELEEAATLRDHLDSDPLVVSLRAAHGNQSRVEEVEPEVRERVLAVERKPKSRSLRTQAPAFWGALAVAAAVALWVGVKSSGTAASLEPPRSLAVSRSTGSLFSHPFDTSSPSERIDKIAQVRARDLRNNRYAQWGLP